MTVSSNRSRAKAFGLALLIAAGGLAVSGCISVLPKTTPVQLYRFGGATEPATPGAASAKGGALYKSDTAFTREAASDRILTVTGQELAYVGGARWVAPAPLLFDEAEARVFASRAGAPRLVARADGLNAGLSLRLDVTSFEARYLHGAQAAPTVVVTIRAVLVRNQDRTLVAEQVFEAEQRAQDNRVGEIVKSFDVAVNQVLGAVADWSSAKANGG